MSIRVTQNSEHPWVQTWWGLVRFECASSGWVGVILMSRVSLSILFDVIPPSLSFSRTFH